MKGTHKRRTNSALVLLPGGLSSEKQRTSDAEWSRFCSQIGWQDAAPELAPDYEANLLERLLAVSPEAPCATREVAAVASHESVEGWLRFAPLARPSARTAAFGCALVAAAACFLFLWLSGPVGFDAKARQHWEQVPALVKPPVNEPAPPPVLEPPAPRDLAEPPSEPPSPDSGALISHTAPRASARRAALRGDKALAPASPTVIAASPVLAASPSVESEPPHSELQLAAASPIAPREWRQPVAEEVWSVHSERYQVARPSLDWSLSPSHDRFLGVVANPVPASHPNGFGVAAQVELTAIGRL